MRLLHAILAANQRRVAGDFEAGVGAEFDGSLPLAALTCIDPRLNPLFPRMLGIADDKFVWLRNAGNIITGPLSSTMRSLAMAGAIKGAREVAVIGHSDCQVAKTTPEVLLERLESFGVEPRHLPNDPLEFFDLFGSERENVLRGVEVIRMSPLVGRQVPVHGLLIDVHSGALECVINGYDAMEPALAAATRAP